MSTPSPARSLTDSRTVELLVVSVADQARRVGAGQTQEVASDRLPTRTGGWLLVDASLLDAGADGRVKAIFAKVGVGSRGNWWPSCPAALRAQPRAGATVGTDGWFADASPPKAPSR